VYGKTRRISAASGTDPYTHLTTDLIRGPIRRSALAVHALATRSKRNVFFLSVFSVALWLCGIGAAGIMTNRIDEGMMRSQIYTFGEKL